MYAAWLSVEYMQRAAMSPTIFPDVFLRTEGEKISFGMLGAFSLAKSAGGATINILSGAPRAPFESSGAATIQGNLIRDNIGPMSVGAYTWEMMPRA